jgi:hypothetical protein
MKIERNNPFVFAAQIIIEKYLFRPWGQGCTRSRQIATTLMTYAARALAPLHPGKPRPRPMSRVAKARVCREASMGCGDATAFPDERMWLLSDSGWNSEPRERTSTHRSDALRRTSAGTGILDARSSTGSAKYHTPVAPEGGRCVSANSSGCNPIVTFVLAAPRAVDPSL